MPHVDVLSRADARIRELTADSEARGAPPRTGHGRHWIFVGIVGFFLWVLAAFTFSQKAVDREGRWVPKAGRLWASVFTLGFAAFVLGLALA